MTGHRGSWGSTLALAYAQAHPDKVTALVLRGIFLCRRSEIDWFLYGMRQIYPETWRAFAEFLPEAERGDILAAYHKRLVDPDPAVHLPAARAWSTYEGACSTLLPSPETVAAFGADRQAFCRSAEALRGVPLVMGDAAYELPALPRLPVTVALWLADDEFAARVQFLVDKAADRQLPLDALWVLCRIVAKRLVASGETRRPR